MLKKTKKWVLALAGVFAMTISWSQQIIPVEIPGDLSKDNDSAPGLLQYAVHKQLPAGYEKETLEALSHFPELKNTYIRFRIKKSFATLKTRPAIISVFMPKGHRKYVITISNKTSAKLVPLLFMHLSMEARTGVIGHELSHVLDFSKKNGWQFIKIAAGHLSPRYLDRFEYNTDLICIQHGLGKDLESWSSYIRKTMHTVFWRGADYVYKGDAKYERYMNPATIEKHLPDNVNTAGGAK